MNFTYINLVTNTRVTVIDQDEHLAWEQLCTKIAPSDQLNFVLSSRKLEHRIVATADISLYLIVKDENVRKCVKHSLLHHKQRLESNFLVHCKKRALAKKNLEQAEAHILYDTISLN